MSKTIRDLIQKNEGATDEANQNEQRFRDVAEVSSGWVWETDFDQKVVYMAERFAELTNQMSRTHS